MIKNATKLNKKRRRALWAKALESSKYAQGIGQLKDENDQYCCLGVACDVYRKATGKGRWTRKSNRYSFGESLAYLPLEVVKWFGLDDEDPTLRGNREIATVVNDVHRNSFNEIAKMVRAL